MFFPKVNALPGVAGAFACLALIVPARADKTAPKTAAKRLAAPAAIPTASRLAYDLPTGKTLRYKVVGIFSGHIPPFAQPGSQPIHIKIQLTYNADIKKPTDKGTEVAFTVDAADVILLEKAPGPDGKVDPQEEIPFPLPLSQVQQALNVTAILRPDGSVAEIKGGEGAPPVRIDLGFDLRKLFLLMMPVVFPEKALQIRDTWTFAEGVIGNNPGKVSYTGQLKDVRPQAQTLVYHITQNAQATIDDRRDKSNNPAQKPEDAVETTTGKVTFSGDMNFVTPAKAATDGLRAGRLAEGRMQLIALITRKRAEADPNKPEEPLETNIDVNARLTVQAEVVAGKPAAARKAAKPAPKKAVAGRRAKR